MTDCVVLRQRFQWHSDITNDTPRDGSVGDGTLQQWRRGHWVARQTDIGLVVPTRTAPDPPSQVEGRHGSCSSLRNPCEPDPA